MRLLGYNDEGDDHLDSHEDKHELVVAMYSHDGERDAQDGEHDRRMLGHVRGERCGRDHFVKIEALSQIFLLGEYDSVGGVGVAGEQLLLRVIQVLS